MKRIYFFFILVLMGLNVFSQANYDAFVGTWIYQKNDTVFKIRLQKGIMYYYSGRVRTVMFGGYSLNVKSVFIEDYIKPIPEKWFERESTAPSNNIFIEAVSDTPDYLSFTFYDQRKQHADGKGLSCGSMDLITPNKLHWKLNEYEGLWWRYEGTEEGVPALRGFSVPDDVIMTKEE